MKKLKTSVNIGFFLLSAFAFVGLLALPFVGVNTASAQYATPSCTSATLNGSVTPNGAPTQVWFEWGAGSSLSNTTSKQTFSSNSNFSQYISGLTENTTYSYRAMASNVNGTATGQTLTFKTNTCTPVVQAPTVNLTADSSSVSYNGTTTVRWTSQNATSCVASSGVNGWSGSKATSGNFYTGNLTNTTTYNITCSNSAGSASDSVTVSVGSQPVYNPTVNGNNAYNTTCTSATLNGSVTPNGAPTQVWFEWGAGSSLSNTTSKQTFSSNSNFSQYISGLTENTTYSYRAMASNVNGTATGQTLTFKTNTCVTPPPQTCQDYNATNYKVSYPCSYVVKSPVVTLTADNTNLNFNGNTTVRWTSSYATSCFANGGSNGWTGARMLSGNFYTGALTSDTTYNITCTNSAGSDTKSITVYVAEKPVPLSPTVNLTADNSNLAYNGATTVRWTSTNATTCTTNGGVNGWAGSKGLSGAFYTGSLVNTITYNITCYNSVASASDSVTVTVGTQPILTCKDIKATNYGGVLPCKYAPVIKIPTVAITADDLVLEYGDNTNVRWTSTNAVSCTADAGTYGWTGLKNTSGVFYTGALKSTTTYNITCKSSTGHLANATVKVTVNPQKAPTVGLSVDKSTVPYNGATNVRWTSENATVCITNGGANGWTNPKELSGIFYTGALTSDTTYNITCKNAVGQFATASETINVGTVTVADPTVDIFVDDANIIHGGSTNVRWVSENATSCTGNGGSNGWTNSKALSGIFYTGNLTITTTYNITCKNAVGKIVTGSVKVNVDGMPNSNPAVVIFADQMNLASGESTNVRFNSTNAVSCYANAGSNGWAGSKGLAGIFYTGTLTKNTTFNITCNGSTGASASASVTIYVQAPTPTVTITANPNMVVLNGSSTVSWTSTNATSCSASNGTNNWSGNKNLSGSFFTGSLSGATTFTIDCSNGTGSATSSVTISIKPKLTIITL